MASNRINLAVLISGGGTTLANLIDHVVAGKLDARISQVIASRPGIGGIEKAQRAGVGVEVVQRSNFETSEAYSNGVFGSCARAGVDLICLGGWLSMICIPREWRGRVMNIHPALLPSFGGKGMYGRHVHEAVLAHGCKVSGCTVHFVDEDYDNGPIILQRVCPVMEDDTAETLAHRVFEEEKIAYPQAIRLFAGGKLRIEGRRVRVA